MWQTFPEVLQAAGVSWKIYQDLAGTTFAPDLGDGTSNSFAGNFTDNSVLYFNNYATAPTSSPLFQNGCSGTNIISIIPVSSASEQDWQTDDWSRGSGDVPSGDYELWVRLANDPSQPEQARQQYRERMAEYVHQKMRAAFRFATQQTLNSPADGKSATHCAGAGATDQE